MQEKALVAHLELHKKVVKNAWILSYEGRKVLVIEFRETVTEDESIAYIFALAKSLVSGKRQRNTQPGADEDGKRNLCPDSGRRNEETY